MPMENATSKSINIVYQHRIISIGLKSNAAISVLPMALVVNCRPVGSADFAGVGFNPCRW
jgi:hypothetical protein